MIIKLHVIEKQKQNNVVPSFNTKIRLYYKNIMIINDTFRVVRMTIVSDSPSCALIIILTILEMSSIVPENIYSTGITHDDRHLQLPYFYSTGHRFVQIKQMELFEVSIFGIFPAKSRRWLG